MVEQYNGTALAELAATMDQAYADDQRVAGRGTDVLAIPSIDVVDGQVTAYVYAAYYS